MNSILLAFLFILGSVSAENGVSLGYEDFISTHQYFTNGACLGEEVCVRSEETCSGAAYWTAEWSKLNNAAKIHFEAFGWPKRNTFEVCYDRDISTAYNQWPTGCVKKGFWRMWFLAKLFSFPVTYIYDQFGILIGNEYDIGGLSCLPAGHFNITGKAVHSVCSPPMMTDNKGNIDFDWNFAYNDVRDELGNSGYLASIVRRDANDPTSYIFHYTDVVDLIKPLPIIDFEDVIDFVNFGGAMSFGLTYEPDDKPAYLASRSNAMPTGSAQYSLGPPSSFCSHAGRLPGTQTFADLFDNGSRCGSFQLPRTILAATFPCSLRSNADYAIPDVDCA